MAEGMAGDSLYLRGEQLHKSTDYCFGCIHSLSISTNEDKHVIWQMFSFAVNLRDNLRCLGLC